MDMINGISLALFIVFFSSYVFKLLILYKRYGIKANVLGKSGKDKTIHKTEVFVKATTFLWGFAWLLFSAAELRIKDITGTFIEKDSMRMIGVMILAVGVAIFMVAMISMKTSWRVGIDKKTKPPLVTSGIYKYSRNPSFVGFDAMFLGFLITYFNMITVIIVVLNFIAIHLLILQEERHLGTLFGDAYAQYKEKTPRYILIK